MPILNPTYATLVLAKHSKTSEPYGAQIIIGFGLIIVSKRNDNEWGYSVHTAVVDTLGDEAQLLVELADALPHPTFLFGHGIEANIIAPLERAADRQSPTVAAHLLQRLARLQSARQVDAAPTTRPNGYPAYTQADQAMPGIVIDVSGETIIDTEAAYCDLEQHVIDEWWRFVSPVSLQ
jgi:hypothetical protein